MSTSFSLLFVAFLSLIHKGVHPGKIQGMQIYANHEQPRISRSVICIPQPTVDILNACLQR